MGGDPPAVTGAPTPVGSMHEVGQDDVAVEVGIAIAADSVREDSGEGATGGQHSTSGTRSPGGGDGVAFQVRKGAGDCVGVRRDHGAGRVGARQREDDAGRLRRAEGEVERRHGGAARSEHDARVRVAALKQPVEFLGANRAAEAKGLRRVPGPVTRSGDRQLTGEVGEVVIGPAPPDPVDPEHCWPPLRPGAWSG